MQKVVGQTFEILQYLYYLSLIAITLQDYFRFSRAFLLI